jgi:hypothetical protein
MHRSWFLAKAVEMRQNSERWSPAGPCVTPLLAAGPVDCCDAYS